MPVKSGTEPILRLIISVSLHIILESHRTFARSVRARMPGPVRSMTLE